MADGTTKVTKERLTLAMSTKKWRRLSAGSKPLFTSVASARLHEPIGVAVASKQPDDLGVGESVFVLIFADYHMDGHGLLPSSDGRCELGE